MAMEFSLILFIHVVCNFLSVFSLYICSVAHGYGIFTYFIYCLSFIILGPQIHSVAHGHGISIRSLAQFIRSQLSFRGLIRSQFVRKFVSWPMAMEKPMAVADMIDIITDMFICLQCHIQVSSNFINLIRSQIQCNFTYL